MNALAEEPTLTVVAQYCQWERKLIALLITGNKFVVVFVGAPQKDNNNVRIHNKTAGDFNMLHYIPEGTT